MLETDAPAALLRERQSIRHSFAQAAPSYDGVAQLQRAIAHELLTQTPSALGGTILDAGCGTGFGLRLLQTHNPAARVIALDHAHSMLRIASHTGANVCGGIESLALADQSLDMYWSSLAWQWTQPLDAIAEAARCLKPGGLLRVATLGPATLHELRRAFTNVDQAAHTRQFAAPDIYAPLLEVHGFHNIQITQSSHTQHAVSLRPLLQSLRDLGANHVGTGQRRGLMSRSAWLRLEQAYESQRQSAGLPMTYDAILISATRT